ncbi:NADPH:quinone reductase [Ktedonobacter sp. SOSP1-52]|uniref:NADP-dependent oxidoreductase n=1 Tax=Ktedonobacter sp. SOSP1-52 TaxID=2778366 RepID=UPI001915DF6A|nr:NADP-dependent oxidoreductase [Ktedonobacter sp. SOSP1-52]GHO71485.1 NADPH:quinone reductase [Ktedonobacter sp. SOSP1-52]
MKAIRLYGQSGPDQCVFEDAPQPQPGVGEVLIRVHATSVMWQEPTWSETWKTPAGIERQHPIPGHDVSGEVVEVGPDVTGVAVGEAIYALTEFWRDGAAAEYTIARATDVAPKPRTLEHIQAAGVPLVGLTAWQALFEHAGLTSGQSLLIHGAAGGVGSMAVQMAKWAGATVIATASAHNHAFLRTLGADEIIDYTTTRFEEVVRDVDLVLDTIGGETEARSWRVLRKGGLLLSVFSPPSQEQAAAFGVRELFFVVKPNREQLIDIGDLIDTGQLRPIIKRVFPLSEASQAFEQALQGHTRGKIILRIEDEERRR